MRKKNFDLGDILADSAEEDDYLELPLAEKVFLIFRTVTIIVFSLVALRIIIIGFFWHNRYFERALANASNFRIVRAERGLITDRYKKPLVQNEKAFYAFLSVKDLPEDEEKRDAVFFKVSEILGIDRKGLELDVLKKRGFFDDRIILSENLSYENLVQISALSLPGVKIEEGFKRVHQIPLVFSHVLGYTGLVTEEDLKTRDYLSLLDETGKNGLEKYYDSDLRGKNGREVYFRDSSGGVQDRRVVELPEQGARVETYIDKEFQEYFYNRLSEELERLGRRIGVGIALNPQNGEVLALFDAPSFDAGNIVSYLSDKDRPLFNRAITGLYTPGSTIKPLVALGALTEGIIAPEKKIFSAGYIEIPNPFQPENPSIFKDWRAHGWVDVSSALARSSNVYFYAVGGGFKDQVGLGIKRLKQWWQRFNLDKKTLIDLPGEEAGFLPDPEWKKERTGRNWLLGDTYNVSIGQGDFSITPIELLNYISAFANGGTFYNPRIMKSVINARGETIKESESVSLGKLDDELSRFLPFVQQGMRDAVKKPYGTAYLVSGVPMPIAAKTGSSQILNRTKTNAFFVGYAPAQDYEENSPSAKPELAILILVENAREGSVNTIPVARDVFMWYYEHRMKIR